MPASFGTFKGHVGYARETVFGTTIAAPTLYVPYLNASFEDDQGLVFDEGVRAKASKLYGVYTGVQQSKLSYDFPYYPNEMAQFWACILGTDTIGSSSNGAWQHTFTLADLGPSLTIYDFYGSTGSANYGAERVVSGSQIERLEFKVARNSGFATVKTSFIGAAPSSGVTENSPSYTSDPALRGFQGVFSVAGTTFANLLDFELNITRETELIFAGNNTQRPSNVEYGNIDVTGKISWYGSTDRPMVNYRASTGGIIDVLFSASTAVVVGNSTMNKLELLLTNAFFTKVVPDRSGKYLRYDAEFRAQHNATDAGPMQVLATVSTSSQLST